MNAAKPPDVCLTPREQAVARALIHVLVDDIREDAARRARRQPVQTNASRGGKTGEAGHRGRWRRPLDEPSPYTTTAG
jgi:hypothetical protein